MSVAVVVLWMRSYSEADYFQFMHASGGFRQLIASHGDLIIYVARSDEGNSQPGFHHFQGKPLSMWHRPGMFPVQWQWGFFEFTAVLPPPPPSQAELKRVADARKELTDLDGASSTRAAMRRVELKLVVSGIHRNSHWSFLMPAWLVTLTTLIVPAVRGVSAWSKRRNVNCNRCRFCGYDLTANVSGVCPECGAACKAASPAGASPAAGD